MKRAVFAFLILFCSDCMADKYRFVSINGLAEQEVGRLVMPQIYAQLGHTITITPVPGMRAQDYATRGLSHGEIMRIYSYGEENSTVIRIPTPYYYLETMPFVHKDNHILIETKQDLASYSIAKVRGVKHTDNITRGLSRVHNVDSTQEMMKLLNDGLVDVALTNTIDGDLQLRRLGYTDIEKMQKPLATLALYHYVHIEQRHLVEPVDKQIKKMKASGELETMLKQAERVVMQR